MDRKFSTWRDEFGMINFIELRANFATCEGYEFEEAKQIAKKLMENKIKRIQKHINKLKTLTLENWDENSVCQEKLDEGEIK